VILVGITGRRRAQRKVRDVSSRKVVQKEVCFLVLWREAGKGRIIPFSKVGAVF